MIELFKHNIDQRDIDNCVKVLKSNWHTAGPINKQVEELISFYYGPDFHCVLTSSCTSGLMAVAVAMGLSPEDEIITSPMTFTATAASAMHYGVKPVFADIDPNTGLIDIDQIEDKITCKTEAIYVVNLYGHMPDMKKLREIADKYKLYLIEDCAHAFDSMRDKYRPATYSHAACYSFYATKNTHCGEGGAVISKDKDFIDKIRKIRRHGLTKVPVQGQPGNIGYDVINLGFKGTMSDITASLLLNQIVKTDDNRNTRELIAKHYICSFSDLKNVKCVIPDDCVKSSWYTFPILVDNRDSLMAKLRKENIGHTIMYTSLQEFTLYKNWKRKQFEKVKICQNALEFGHKQLSLPCYNSLRVGELEKIVKVVKEWDKECC